MKRIVMVCVVFISVFLLGVAGNVLASPVTYVASNIGGPLWDRPYRLSGITGISSLGSVNYHVQPFFTDIPGLYEIVSIQEYDGFLHLYEDSFNPLDQLTNLIDLNDDKLPRILGPPLWYSVLSVTLLDDTQYYLVTSAYRSASHNVGTFTNTISYVGDDVTLGEMTVVPVASSIVLLSTGIIGLAGLSRKFRKS